VKLPSVQISPQAFRRFHLVLMVVWALLLIPTLIFWRSSVLWVATMSLYANFVGHFSAWQAVRSEEAS
jgi:hypothetical protein